MIEVPSWDQVDAAALCRDARLLAFDLDNTLAFSRKPMSPAMASRISQLTRLIPLAVITGGRHDLVVKQVLDMLDEQTNKQSLYLMPATGTQLYLWVQGAWHCEYSYVLSAEERDAAVRSLMRHAQEDGLLEGPVWGERIEDRGSQITFSALGQLAPEEAKLGWDPTDLKKERLAEAVARDLPRLAVHPGGLTSIDVSKQGIDKAYAVRKLSELLDIPVANMVMVGDRMTPGGNDYPAAAAGALAVRVSNPEDTLALCDRLLAELRPTGQ
ncbi:HAD-IIB family hydrolase [Bifidobacterium aemilianum]|nr:HAD-IIB family hydrolase [Bifidobacterium aemilianum]